MVEHQTDPWRIYLQVVACLVIDQARTGLGAPVRAVTVHALARINLMSEASHSRPKSPTVASKSEGMAEKLKSVAEEATDVIKDSFTTATDGASELGLKMIEVVRENSNSTLDFATKLLKAKSLSEAVDLSTAQTRKQYEAMTTQTKELATIARKVAADTSEPVRESLSKVFVVKAA